MQSIVNTSTDLNKRDEKWMQHALILANQAAALGEVPVGAVLVMNDTMVGVGQNKPIASCDPTAHAEIIALRTAANQLTNYRLIGSTLYVTLEPCIMCLGAILHARIKRLVFAALDPKTGAVASAFHLLDAKHNHRVVWEGGCLAGESQQLLKDFFLKKRS